MTDFLPMTLSQVVLGVRELESLANALCLPDHERYGMLGLSWSAYRSWQSGSDTVARSTPPELVRRLSYALPLMRRMAANMPPATVRHSRNQSQPMAD